LKTQASVQPRLNLEVSPADMEDTYLVSLTIEAEGSFA